MLNESLAGEARLFSFAQRQFILNELGDNCMLLIDSQRDQHGDNGRLTKCYTHSLNRSPFDVAQMGVAFTLRVKALLIIQQFHVVNLIKPLDGLESATRCNGAHSHADNW